MDRYIGLDVHAASTTIGIIGPSGKRLRSVVVETNGQAVSQVLRTLPGRRHVCLEEGTQAEWLYGVLKPHVDRIVVIRTDKARGTKNDQEDAFRLAELLRTGMIETSVFKDAAPLAPLRELSRVYQMILSDVVRTKNRLKSIFRSRGVQTPDATIYDAKRRQVWLDRLPAEKRSVAEMLYAELDALTEFRRGAERALVQEAHRQPVARKLETCPGLGPIRVAHLMAVVVTPHRFRTKRQLWAYSGLGIVMRSSSDWVHDKNGGWMRANLKATRGLNKNHNHVLKDVFKGAAITVIRSPESPLGQQYQQLLAAGTKPNLARLTIARRIAAIVLAMWKHGEEYKPSTKIEDSTLVA